MAPVEEGSALALPAQQQLVVQAQRYQLADRALKVCGLARPGGPSVQEKHVDGFSVDKERIQQMNKVLSNRGVRKRLEEDFDLQFQSGEGAIEKETPEEFVGRTILQLRKANVGDVVKAFVRVEKNNRKAAANDASFIKKQMHCRAKVADDDFLEQAEDIEYGTKHIGSTESFAEVEDWFAQFEYREREKDFTAFCAGSVFRGGGLSKEDEFCPDDLTRIHAALVYFEANDSSLVKMMQGVESPSADTGAIKAALGRWTPSMLVSVYRRLSLAKHPDKEGGSPEAFQELTEHAKVLSEACGKAHGSTTVRSGKKAAASNAGRGPPKAAICAELPASLATAVEFFSFTQDDFRFGSAAHVKRIRLQLSAGKERIERQIHREKESAPLLDLLRKGEPPSPEGEEEGSPRATMADACPEACGRVAEEAHGRRGKHWRRWDQVDPDGLLRPKPQVDDLKQLKAQSTSLCRKHYGSLYAYIQKLKLK